MSKTVYDERRLFYYHVGFICDKEAQKYLKIIKDSGEAVCLAALSFYENKPNLVVDDYDCFSYTSAGTDDKVFENDNFCMVYNTGMEYFHLLGRKRVYYHFCCKCDRWRCTEDMKFDPLEGDCVCKICANPEYYKEL